MNEFKLIYTQRNAVNRDCNQHEGSYNILIELHFSCLKFDWHFKKTKVFIKQNHQVTNYCNATLDEWQLAIIHNKIDTSTKGFLAFVAMKAEVVSKIFLFVDQHASSAELVDHACNT